MRAITTAIAGAFALLALTSRALADQPSASDTEQARQRFERGVDLFAQKDYGSALAEFKRAYELAPYPVILYNLGLTYSALNRPVEASEALEKVVQQRGSLSADRIARAKEIGSKEAARVAELAIESSVAGARIAIDGVDVANAPLPAPVKVKGGPHRVTAVLAGYVPTSKEIDASAGSRTAVKLDLMPTDKKLAHVQVLANVAGATLAVDNENAGTTPLASSIALLPGAHHLELRRAGYKTAMRDITLGDGSSGELTIDLVEDPADVARQGARLELAISEPEAVVTIDGVPRGAARDPIAVAPGPHHVRIDRSGFFAIERDVDAAPGTSVRVDVTLEPTADHRAAYVSRNGTFRTLGIVGVVSGAVVAGAGLGFVIWNRGKVNQASSDLLDFQKISANGSGGRCDSLASTWAQNEQSCTEELATLNDHQDAARAREPIGFIGIGVGAAAIIAGTVLLIAGDDPHRYDKKPSGERFGRTLLPFIAPLPHGGALGLSASF